MPIMDVPGLAKPFDPTDYEEDSDSDTTHTDIRRFLDPVHDYGEFGLRAVRVPCVCPLNSSCDRHTRVRASSVSRASSRSPS